MKGERQEAGRERWERGGKQGGKGGREGGRREGKVGERGEGGRERWERGRKQGGKGGRERGCGGRWVHLEGILPHVFMTCICTSALLLIASYSSSNNSTR